MRLANKIHTESPLFDYLKFLIIMNVFASSYCCCEWYTVLYFTLKGRAMWCTRWA